MDLVRIFVTIIALIILAILLWKISEGTASLP